MKTEWKRAKRNVSGPTSGRGGGEREKIGKGRPVDPDPSTFSSQRFGAGISSWSKEGRERGARVAIARYSQLNGIKRQKKDQGTAVCA